MKKRLHTFWNTSFILILIFCFFSKESNSQSLIVGNELMTISERTSISLTFNWTINHTLGCFLNGIQL